MLDDLIIHATEPILLEDQLIKVGVFDLLREVVAAFRQFTGEEVYQSFVHLYLILDRAVVLVELVEDLDQFRILRDLLYQFIQRLSALIGFPFLYLEITLEDKCQVHAGLDGLQIQQAVGLYFMHF